MAPLSSKEIRPFALPGVKNRRLLEVIFSSRMGYITAMGRPYSGLGLPTTKLEIRL